MKKEIFGMALGVILFTLSVSAAEAQQPKVYRVGVLTPGGAWYEIIDGLRAGLKQLGFEEGKQFVSGNPGYKGRSEGGGKGGEEFRTRESQPDIYNSNLSHHSSKAGDGRHPHRLFCRGRPGCSRASGELRKTGGKTHRRLRPGTDLTAKRLEILKEIVPKLRRVVAFYDPRNPVATSPPS